ncbi:hypothetical protein Tco_0526816 [Tanacetum coccineum]
MLTEAIKQSESYQMFIKYSTSQIPPKKSKGKGSQGKKTLDTTEEIVDLGKSMSLTEAAEKEAARQFHATHARIVTELVPKPARRRPSGIAFRDTSSVSKKMSLDPSHKLKGVQSLTPEEQLAADTMKALKESKKTSKRQPGTRGSSEGTSVSPRVLNESTFIPATSSEGTGTKPGVPNEEKVTSEANVILEWGLKQESEYTEEDDDDETIKWVDTNKEEDKKDDDDDKSIDLELADDEETDDEFVHEDEHIQDDDEFVHGDEQVNDDEDEEMTNAEVEKSGTYEKYTDALRRCWKTDNKDMPRKQNFLQQAPAYQILQMLRSTLYWILKSNLKFHISNLHPSCNNFSTPPYISTIPHVLLQTTTPIPTPPIITKAPTINTAIPESDELTAVQLRVAKLEKDVSELKKIDHSAESLDSLKS